MNEKMARSDTAEAVPYCYRLHGLELWSDFRLEELAPAIPVAPDIRIRRTEIDRDIAHGQGTILQFGKNECFMAWDSVGRFLIAGAGEIRVQPAPGVADDLVAFPLLGPVIAMAMHRRGAFVMHASAVSIEGAGVAFLGNKGAGKSTTATAMLAAGHRLLTDDVLVASPAAGFWRIEPSSSQVKLSPDAAAGFDLADAEIRPPAHAAIMKRLHRLPAQFADRAAPLRRVYVLRRGERAAITTLNGRDGFIALAAFSYAARFGSAALAGDDAARHMARLQDIHATASVRELEVPGTIARLGDVAQLIEADLR